MQKEPVFSLGERLRLCADFVRRGSVLADIGTDHGYLPIWLMREGLISRAIACDVNPGPLEAARRNGQRYRVRLRLVLGDGLRALGPEDFGDGPMDIVLAGMGGELILRIVSEAPWLREERVRLILQPMTMADRLRAGLWDLGFCLERERAVRDGGKVYSAFPVRYAPERTMFPMPEGYLCTGLLRPGEGASKEYAEKVLRDLNNRLLGARHAGNREDEENLRGQIQGIEERFCKNI